MIATLSFKTTKLASMWREHNRKREQMAITIMQLLGHPEATPEQIARVRQCAIDIEQQHRSMREALQTKFPTIDWRQHETR